MILPYVLEERETKWFEAMKAKGHSPILDKGGLYLFAYDENYHNGPGCSICDWSCCWHCDDIEDIPPCNVIESRPALLIEEGA